MFEPFRNKKLRRKTTGAFYFTLYSNNYLSLVTSLNQAPKFASLYQSAFLLMHVPNYPVPLQRKFGLPDPVLF